MKFRIIPSALRFAVLCAICCSLSGISLGQIITTFAGNGSTTFSGDGGSATAAGLTDATHMAFDGSGNMYFTGQTCNNIRKISTTGIITTVAGTGAAGFSGDGGPATAARFNDPYGIAIDTSGNVYVSDYYNHRIRKISTSGIISTFAGNGTTAFSGDGGQATAASLYAPAGLAFDHHGNLLICDAGNNRVRKVTPSGIISTIAGRSTTAGFSGDGGQATAADMHGVDCITIDPTGNLYLSDHYRVRKIDTTGIITSVAGTGSMGFSGDGGSATAASLNQEGLATDAAGNLFISDLGNHRVRKVSPSGIINTIAGNGSTGFSGDGGSPLSASLWLPFGLVFDAAGNMYIGDIGNNRIRKISPSSIIVGTIENNFGISVYPNPVTDKITIATNLPLVQKYITLRDINGKLILSQSEADANVTLQLDHMIPGMYFLETKIGTVVYNNQITVE